MGREFTNMLLEKADENGLKGQSVYKGVENIQDIEDETMDGPVTAAAGVKNFKLLSGQLFDSNEL